MVKKGAKAYVVSTATALTVSAIGKVLGMADGPVAKILAVGIPVMMWVASDDPKITDLLFKESRKKDRKKDKGVREAKEDYLDIFGDKGHKMDKAIAKATDTIEEEVDGVMSLFLDTFIGAIAREEPEDAKALGQMFKKETDEYKEKNPSFARMVMNLVF
jgi:hypothetical protein